MDGGEEGEPLAESQQCPWLLKATRGWLCWWFFCHTLCFPFPLPRPKLGCCFSSKLASSSLPPQKNPQPKLLEEKHGRPPEPAMHFKQGRVRKPEPANIAMPGAHSWGHTRTSGGSPSLPPPPRPALRRAQPQGQELSLLFCLSPQPLRGSRRVAGPAPPRREGSERLRTP